MAYIDVVAVKKAVKDGALIVKVVDGNILLADVKSGEAAKIGELPVGRWEMRGGKRYCANCGTRACVTRDREDFWYTVGTPFCPNCGAMMKGAGDNGVEN